MRRIILAGFATAFRQYAEEFVRWILLPAGTLPNPAEPWPFLRQITP
jgi:hypothetical protein